VLAEGDQIVFTSRVSVSHAVTHGWNGLLGSAFSSPFGITPGSSVPAWARKVASLVIASIITG
jgi:hypothetical protein